MAPRYKVGDRLTVKRQFKYDELLFTVGEPLEIRGVGVESFMSYQTSGKYHASKHTCGGLCEIRYGWNIPYKIVDFNCVRSFTEWDFEF